MKKEETNMLCLPIWKTSAYFFLFSASKCIPFLKIPLVFSKAKKKKLDSFAPSAVQSFQKTLFYFYVGFIFVMTLSLFFGGFVLLFWGFLFLFLVFLIPPSPLTSSSSSSSIDDSFSLLFLKHHDKILRPKWPFTRPSFFRSFYPSFFFFSPPFFFSVSLFLFRVFFVALVPCRYMCVLLTITFSLLPLPLT